MGKTGAAPQQFCKTCNHPNRGQIDAELARGAKSDRQVARENPPLTHHNVGRHRRLGHVAADASGSTGASVRVPPGPNDRSALGFLRRTLYRLERMDTSKMRPRELMQHADGVRRTAEAIAKMEPAERRTATLAEVQGLSELFQALFEELEPYPDVRERVSARVQELHADGVIP